MFHLFPFFKSLELEKSEKSEKTLQIFYLAYSII
jgi:hypothetical protein